MGTSLSPGQRATIELKLLVFRGSLDDALERAIRQGERHRARLTNSHEALCLDFNPDSLWLFEKLQMPAISHFSQDIHPSPSTLAPR
jgi:hypothetical protein